MSTEPTPPAESVADSEAFKWGLVQQEIERLRKLAADQIKHIHWLQHGDAGLRGGRTESWTRCEQRRCKVAKAILNDGSPT